MYRSALFWQYSAEPYLRTICLIHETIEAISKLPKDAFMPVTNRISNFVLPPSSITFRTFCSRESTIDLEKRMEPGMLTIFRIPSSLPSEFRRIFASAVVMKMCFVSLKRVKRPERAGEEPVARTPVILAADEFRDIAQLRILRTILSQSRKYGLHLWMVAQTLSEIPDDLMGSIQSDVGSVLAFRSSPDDSRKLAKLLYPQKTEAVDSLIPSLEDYAAVVRRRPVGGKPTEPPFRVAFPRLKLLASFGGNRLHRGGLALRRRGQEPRQREGARKGEEGTGHRPLGGPVHRMPLAHLYRQGQSPGPGSSRTGPGHSVSLGGDERTNLGCWNCLTRVFTFFCTKSGAFFPSMIIAISSATVSISPGP